MYPSVIKIKDYAKKHNIEIYAWLNEPTTYSGINHHTYESMLGLRNPYGNLICLGNIPSGTRTIPCYIITYDNLENEIMDRIVNPQ